MNTLTIEPLGDGDLGPCACCGDKSRSVSGIVRSEEGETAYFVHWTEGKVSELGAHFDFLVPTDDRVFGVSVEFRLTDGEPGFMVIDAEGRQVLKRFPGTTPLSRSDVVNKPLAKYIFDALDAI